MTSILQLTTLALATIFAGAAAVALDYLLLRAAFRLMRPATAKHGPARPFVIQGKPFGAQGKAKLAHGTMLLARAFDSHR